MIHFSWITSCGGSRYHLEPIYSRDSDVALEQLDIERPWGPKVSTV